MYCVKCGVRLEDGIEKCPLCRTPVWNPDLTEHEKSFPEEYPDYYLEANRSFALAMSILGIVAVMVTLAVCFRLYGSLRWGGYVIFGIAVFYVIAVLPCWFRRPRGEVFVPIDHVAAALYVLYICLKSGGNWFMSFAFPVILASCILSTGMICLLKYVRGGRLFIFGGFLILLGCFTVLVEFFEHISFGTVMFRWSLYSLAGFATAGICLLLTGVIPSMRHALERRFFF